MCVLLPHRPLPWRKMCPVIDVCGTFMFNARTLKMRRRWLDGSGPHFSTDPFFASLCSAVSWRWESSSWASSCRGVSLHRFRPGRNYDHRMFSPPATKRHSLHVQPSLQLYAQHRHGRRRRTRATHRHFISCFALPSLAALGHVLMLHMPGKGVGKDKEKERIYLVKAAKAGCARARYNLGSIEWEYGNKDKAVRHDFSIGRVSNLLRRYQAPVLSRQCEQEEVCLRPLRLSGC